MLILKTVLFKSHQSDEWQQPMRQNSADLTQTRENTTFSCLLLSAPTDTDLKLLAFNKTPLNSQQEHGGKEEFQTLHDIPPRQKIKLYYPLQFTHNR